GVRSGVGGGLVVNYIRTRQPPGRVQRLFPSFPRPAGSAGNIFFPGGQKRTFPDTHGRRTMGRVRGGERGRGPLSINYRVRISFSPRVPLRFTRGFTRTTPFGVPEPAVAG